jgi:hypothetical protein
MSIVATPLAPALAVWLPQLLEGTMLVCFGIAWPLSTLKMLRSGRPEGKSLGFTLIIWCGYLCGVGAKLIVATVQHMPLPPVLWLYLLNSVTVGTHAWLYWHCERRVRRARLALAGA